MIVALNVVRGVGAQFLASTNIILWRKILTIVNHNAADDRAMIEGLALKVTAAQEAA